MRPEPDIDLGPVSRPDQPGPDPARRRRPVPRSLVAVVSALVGATVVAGYLDRPADDPAGATEPAPLLAPEQWLEMDPNPFARQAELGTDADRSRWRQEIGRHPADATLTLPLAFRQTRLTALPPGSYRVRASCALGEVPERAPGPVRFIVDIREPAGPSVLLDTLHCDGTLKEVSRRLEVTGYRAYLSEFSFAFDKPRETRGGAYYALEQSEPMVVVSFTPA